jgi:hypothetical protein
MSGSPILDAYGAAIGLVSCDGFNPILTLALPLRLGIVPPLISTPDPDR